jgi:transmembrane sensor
MSEDQNTILARWLSNEITEEERQQLESSGDAEALRKITSTMETWSLPDLEDGLFTEIKTKIAGQREAKIVPLYQRRSFLAIAASLVLLAGLFWVLNPFGTTAEFTELACNAGETKVFTLSDQTQITLYGKSKITYDKAGFDKNRRLKLEGEAYFEVNQKGPFEVDFKQGQVNVLGTKFNVLSTNTEAAVKCFEGKVKVALATSETILVPGQGVRKSELGEVSAFDFKAEALPAPGDYRQTENTPLLEVCNTLEVFYDVKIINENVDLDRKFTGGINQMNLDTALTMIFSPMDIAFKRENNTVTIRNK